MIIMIKIIIADDHPIVLGGLKQMIAGESDMELIGEAQNAAELLELFDKRSCDVLVLDISMPGVTSRLLRARPRAVRARCNRNASGAGRPATSART